MTENLNTFQIIMAQLQTVSLFLERPVVQRQVTAFLIATLGAWLLSDGLWYLTRWRVWQWINRRPAEQAQRFWRSAFQLVEYTAFPMWGLLAVRLTATMFVARGWLAGLLDQMVLFFWVLLFYRFLLALLYMTFGRPVMYRYHRRLLAPVFALLVGFEILNSMINLGLVASIQLFQLFENSVTVGTLFWLAVSLYFLFAIAWAVQEILHHVFIPRTTIDPGAIDAALTLGRYLVILLGVLMVFGAIGFDPTSLALIGGALSFGIGFGLREVISNFTSGIILLFENSLRPGDIVNINGVLGTVDKLSFRATTVRTFDNVEMLIPNQQLFISTVTSYTRSNRIIRVVMTIGVSYKSNPKEVMEILVKAAREHGLVLDEPEPVVFFENFGESSLDFHLAIWLDDPKHMKRVPSDLRLMIWKEFEKQGIEIPFPQRDLHVRSGPPWEKLDALALTEEGGSQS